MNRLEDMSIQERRVCRQYIARAYDACSDMNAPAACLYALAAAVSTLPLPEDDKEGKE